MVACLIDLIVPWERVDVRDPTRFKEDPLKTDELRALFRSALLTQELITGRSLSSKTLSRMSSAPHKRLTCPKPKYRLVNLKST
jgi:hypothetical protein